MRLRSYLEGQEIDLLKLDIECAESEVLVDCRDQLSNVARVFVEWHSFAERQQTVSLIVETLTSAGFRLHFQPGYHATQPFVDRASSYGMDNRVNIFAYRNGLEEADA